jgi:uncharacterized Tic20 family protein
MNDSRIDEGERGLAVLAHLSGYAGYVVPCGGVLAPLILMLTSKSAKIIALAKQALLLNVLGFLTIVLSIVAFGPLALFVAKQPVLMWLVLGLVGSWAALVVALVVVCPIIGAIKASNGEYFRYPLFGVTSPTS